MLVLIMFRNAGFLIGFSVSVLQTFINVEWSVNTQEEIINNNNNNNFIYSPISIKMFNRLHRVYHSYKDKNK